MVNDYDSVLQEIYSASVVPFSVATYLCRTPEYYMKPLSINTQSSVFNFWLLDEDQQYINLNGHSLSLTLLVFKKSNVHDVIKNYIKYRLQNE
jgi:hypothetical protein